ncbi:MAG: oligosaccharide flippase family protein [Amaricoccus sp.]|uniref:oligosaccharide flippase family protein n=1 Tax=Amaricoccus sp. TaxID=1872485 RepID=UPI0033164922
MSVVRRSVLFSAIEKYLSQALAIGTMAVMARVLTPAETGLFLTAYSVITLADGFREFGIGSYLVQAGRLTRDEVRTAFTVTFLLSMVIGCGIVLASAPLAAFYGDGALRPLLVTASLAFVVMPFGTPISALMRRDLAFRAIATINVGVAITNAVATIGLGLAGFGPMSYVLAYVASALAGVGLTLLVRPDVWIFRPCFREARRIFVFGVVAAGISVVNIAYEILPRLVLGKLLGFGAVGLYSRASSVCQIPDRVVVSALQPVVLPAMAARARAGGELSEAYLRGHELMSAFQWPSLALLALLAHPVVLLLLGPQWDSAVPLVRMIAVATMALAPAFMTYPSLVAAGRIGDALRASLISLPPSIIAIVVAANFGIEAVAASLLVIAPFQMLVALRFVSRAIGLRWRDLPRASYRSAIVTLATSAAPLLVIALSPAGFDLGWLATAVAISGAGAGWLAAVWLTGHPVWAEVGAMWRVLATKFPVPA